MKPKENIVLIGMPAVGKSTVGVLLAKRLGMLFVDTDIVIANKEGKSLQEIIDTRGIARFMEIEEKHVCGLECRCHVIATGGSVVYSEKAMAHLGTSATVVFLDIRLETLEKRLKNISARGVVMEPGQTIADLYNKRRQLYLDHADKIVDCGEANQDQVVEKIRISLSQT